MMISIYYSSCNFLSTVQFFPTNINETMNISSKVKKLMEMMQGLQSRLDDAGFPRLDGDISSNIPRLDVSLFNNEDVEEVPFKSELNISVESDLTENTTGVTLVAKELDDGCIKESQLEEESPIQLWISTPLSFAARNIREIAVVKVTIPVNSLSSLACMKSLVGNEKLISKSKFTGSSSSNNLCAQAVRRNAVNSVSSVLPPKKPPDEFVVTGMSETNINSRALVDVCTALWNRFKKPFSSRDDTRPLKTSYGDSKSRIFCLVWCPGFSQDLRIGRLLSSSIDGSVYEGNLFNSKRKVVNKSEEASIWQMTVAQKTQPSNGCVNGHAYDNDAPTHVEKSFDEVFVLALACDLSRKTWSGEAREEAVCEKCDLTDFCAICLEQIHAQEGALVKGGQHAYSLTYILRWASYKENTTCLQCKHPFELLIAHRAPDGSIQAYKQGKSVGLLLRATLFKPLVVKQSEETCDELDDFNIYVYADDDDEDGTDESNFSTFENMELGEAQMKPDTETSHGVIQAHTRAMRLSRKYRTLWRHYLLGQFYTPRPPELVDLEDKVNFKGRGMLRMAFIGT